MPIQGRRAGRQHCDRPAPVFDELGDRQVGHGRSLGEHVFSQLAQAPQQIPDLLAAPISRQQTRLRRASSRSQSAHFTLAKEGESQAASISMSSPSNPQATSPV